MGDPNELLRHAQDCLKQARSATDVHDKMLFLNMAQAWVKLSEQVKEIRASGVSGDPPVSTSVTPS
jgi:hypothetical protein